MNMQLLVGSNNEAVAKAEGNLIVTDSNGQAVVRGLDSTYTDYYFEEVVAPNGYSINDDDSIVRWGANRQQKLQQVQLV